MKKNLIVFDFDWSLLDENSDAWVVKQLAPEIYGQWRTLYQRDTETWAEFMDKMMGMLHERNVTKEHIEESFRTVPMREAMVEAVRYCKENNSDLIIISGANEFFIEVILGHFGMREIFSAVHTHRSRWHQGRLRVRPYHAPMTITRDAAGRIVREKLDEEDCEEEAWKEHSCTVCTPDLCKGEILAEYIQSGQYDRVFYIGDSDNDFCPSALLSKDDHVLLRKDFSLHKRLQAGQKEGDPTISAHLHLWERAEDVYSIFKTHISPSPSSSSSSSSSSSTS